VVSQLQSEKNQETTKRQNELDLFGDEKELRACDGKKCNNSHQKKNAPRGRKLIQDARKRGPRDLEWLFPGLSFVYRLAVHVLLIGA
jgi:hypothetical protein